MLLVALAGSADPAGVCHSFWPFICLRLPFLQIKLEEGLKMMVEDFRRCVRPLVVFTMFVSTIRFDWGATCSASPASSWNRTGCCLPAFADAPMWTRWIGSSPVAHVSPCCRRLHIDEETSNGNKA